MVHINENEIKLANGKKKRNVATINMIIKIIPLVLECLIDPKRKEFMV